MTRYLHLTKGIFANNARYCDKESASGGHFLYRTFLKMAVEYAVILQEGCNFRKETEKKRVLPPIFQKVKFEMHKNSRIFRIFTLLVNNFLCKTSDLE